MCGSFVACCSPYMIIDTLNMRVLLRVTPEDVQNTKVSCQTSVSSLVESVSSQGRINQKSGFDSGRKRKLFSSSLCPDRLGLTQPLLQRVHESDFSRVMRSVRAAD